MNRAHDLMTTQEKSIRGAFKFAIIVKGIDGVLQIIGGILLIFISPKILSEFIIKITQHELAEDPQDRLANFILQLTHSSGNSQKFAILFLISHGLVNIVIVWGLLKNQLLAYQFGLVIFTGFVVYQMYIYMQTHALMLLLLSILDVIIIGLIWYEYKAAKLAKNI